MKGKLFLLPMVIAEGSPEQTIPPSVIQTVKNLRNFLCENIRTARRYISSLKVHESIESLNFELLNKDTPSSELPRLLQRLELGEDVGLLSESGCPGVADPGAAAVRYAHSKCITVVPLVGPSSILLALMGSGFNGQQFAFHGYLPIDSKEIGTRIRELERESSSHGQTQIFIETPYRNNKLLSHLLHFLQPATMLCVAIDLTSENEKIISMPVGDWKTLGITFEKSPAVFLFLA